MKKAFVRNTAMIAFAACALIVGTGYAAWTYVGADPESRSVEASVSEFKYPGWYDIVDGKEKFNNDLGFLVRGATYDATTHALLTLPSDASSGLSICGLRNYNSCPVVYFPSAIADPNNPRAEQSDLAGIIIDDHIEITFPETIFHVGETMEFLRQRF
jgi:hypothetical protein